MTIKQSKSNIIGRRAELIAELFLQDMNAYYVARPTDDVGYDFFVGYPNSQGGINNYVVQVNATEQPVPSRFSIRTELYKRLAYSNLPALLLVVDVKQNRLFYAWATPEGIEGRQETDAFLIPVTEIDEVVKEELRRQLSSGDDLYASDYPGVAPRQSSQKSITAVSAHLNILKQGVEVWNEWRKVHHEIQPDLSLANFRGADLRGANLGRADLSGAFLSRADLSRSMLSGADLSRSMLSGADLSRSMLSGADLSRADLSGADLSGADLSGADLSGADLSRADLHDANLGGADLRDANLRGANLSGANLVMASFQIACLIDTKLDRTNLTDARLWETQRAGWSIKGVICESVYWDEGAKIATQYSPGDFERLFAEKTKVRLFFKDGISPLEIATLPALIKHLEEAHPGSSLRLVSIHDDAGGAVVELALEDDDSHTPEPMKQLQAALEAEAQRAIEYQRKALAERAARLQLEAEVKQLDSVVDKLIQRHAINIHPGGSLGGGILAQGQVGASGPNTHAHDVMFNQLVNRIEQNIDFAELAKQLGELRQAIKAKQDSSPQSDIAFVKVAEAEIAATEKNTPKVVEHLKAAGKWTLDFAKDIGKNLVVDVIKKVSSLP